MSSDDTVFCISCGAEMSSDTNFCPECGSNQDPENIKSSEKQNVDTKDDFSDHDGFTSWAIGFQAGKTGRNILIGFAYFIFYFIGVPLLVYGYLRENPDKGKYFAWVGGAFLILMALAAISQGTFWGIIAGGISLLLGVFFLPIVRQKLGTGGVPGIDLEDSTRRSVIVGTGYAVGSMVLVGSALPDTETDTSNTGDTNAGENSAASEDNTSSPEFAVRILYDSSWQGALSVTGGGSSQSESISGTGTQTIEITGNVDIISVNAQKQDDSSAELTVQILQNGDVVSESDTTSQYGVAQTGQTF